MFHPWPSNRWHADRPRALALVAPHERFENRFGREAETTVTMATKQRHVKASYAFRKGEVQDKDVERMLADLAKILPPKD